MKRLSGFARAAVFLLDIRLSRWVFSRCDVLFLSKETIDEIHDKVSDKKGFIKLLRADSETIVAKCNDPELKKKLQSFSEEIRYSDPMSNDVAEANDLCDKAHLLLVERNKKCKALK